jgi:hypothetical protein
MSWTWRLESADGTPLPAPLAPVQTTQSDAETWLGEAWRELADEGVAQVSLLFEGELVYGPMSLSE